MPKDKAEAIKWYRKSAEQGFANAQCELGDCYANGRGVPKDEVEAYKWFLLAGAQAKREIARIERELTGTQRAEGQRLAREWKPSKPNSEVKPGTK